jgi:hypothetical protein
MHESSSLFKPHYVNRDGVIIGQKNPTQAEDDLGLEDKVAVYAMGIEHSEGHARGEPDSPAIS